MISYSDPSCVIYIRNRLWNWPTIGRLWFVACETYRRDRTWNRTSYSQKSMQYIFGKWNHWQCPSGTFFIVIDPQHLVHFKLIIGSTFLGLSLFSLRRVSPHRRSTIRHHSRCGCSLFYGRCWVSNIILFCNERIGAYRFWSCSQSGGRYYRS